MKESLYFFGLVIRVIMITMLQLSEQIAIVFSHIFTCVIPFFIILSFAVLYWRHAPSFPPLFLKNKDENTSKEKDESTGDSVSWLLCSHFLFA